MRFTLGLHWLAGASDVIDHVIAISDVGTTLGIQDWYFLSYYIEITSMTIIIINKNSDWDKRNNDVMLRMITRKKHTMFYLIISIIIINIIVILLSKQKEWICSLFKEWILEKS